MEIARRLAGALWAPLAVWAAAGLVLMVGAMLAGFDPAAAETWMRADSEHYLDIAVDGYELFLCDRSVPDVMCGDSGWFPAYPWLFGAIARAGFDAAPVGVAVAWLFSLATLVLLWNTFLRRLPAKDRVAPMLLAAFVPGQIYHRALFPLSMLAFFALLHLWLLSRRRYAAAGLAGAVAAATYQLGVLVVAVGVLFAALGDRSAVPSERRRGAVLMAGLAAIGPLAVVTSMELQTGSWTAYFEIQEKYGHGLHPPVELLYAAIEPLFQGPLLDLANFTSLQTFFVALAIMLLAIWSVIRRRQFSDVDWLLLGVTLVVWVFPLTQANVSLYRSEAALVPAAVLLAKVPRPAALAVVAVAILIAIPIAVLFWQRRLV